MPYASANSASLAVEKPLGHFDNAQIKQIDSTVGTQLRLRRQRLGLTQAVVSASVWPRSTC